MKKITADTSRSYVNVKNLERALDNLNLPETVSYLETWTKDGKVTAVFTNITSNDANCSYLAYIAHKGFKVVG